MIFFRILIFLCIVALACCGCVGLASSSLPPRLNSHDADRIRETHFDFAVGVETNTAGGDVLIAKLRETKMFNAVDYIHLLPYPPSLLARRARAPHGVATIPIRTICTFGILPTTVREPLSFGCSFYSSGLPGREITVIYSYDSITTIGWLAGVMALSPENVLSLGNAAQNHPRYRDQLCISIVDRYEEISNLAQAGRGGIRGIGVIH
jgi:hypothetical protein